MIAYTTATALFWLAMAVIVPAIGYVRSVRQSRRDEARFGESWKRWDRSYRAYKRDQQR